MKKLILTLGVFAVLTGSLSANKCRQQCEQQAKSCTQSATKCKQIEQSCKNACR